MAIIPRKRKNGSVAFQVRVKDPVTRKWKGGTFDDRLDAETEETELKRQARQTEAPCSLEDGKVTKVAEYWLVWANDQRGEVSAGWKKSQDQMYRDYIRDARIGLESKDARKFGDLLMIDVKLPHISRVLNRMREMKPARSPQTIRHVYTLLNQMFEDAADFYKMIPTNPVSAKKHRPEVPKVNRQFLTPADSWRLLDASRDYRGIRSKASYMGRPVWLMLLAGLRYEAIAALRWSDVLWDSNQIRICRAFKRKEGVFADYPKGKDHEYVPLIRDLKAYLLAEWQSSEGSLADFICPGPQGGMLQHGTFAGALTALCKSAKVPEITPHECRHSCTEIWMQAGASREDIQRLLNHKSSASTDGYIHRTEERLFEIADEVSNRRLRVIEGGQGSSFPRSFPFGKFQAESGTGSN